jgi:hypothetical protein
VERISVISSDPTKAAEELEKWAAGLERRAQRYTQPQQRLDATSATGESPDGAIRVTVDANGVPTEMGAAPLEGVVDHVAWVGILVGWGG